MLETCLGNLTWSSTVNKRLSSCMVVSGMAMIAKQEDSRNRIVTIGKASRLETPAVIRVS
jgi:hypothetical protein